MRQGGQCSAGANKKGVEQVSPAIPTRRRTDRQAHPGAPQRRRDQRRHCHAHRRRSHKTDHLAQLFISRYCGMSTIFCWSRKASGTLQSAPWSIRYFITRLSSSVPTQVDR